MVSGFSISQTYIIASLGSLGSTQACSLPLWEHSKDTLRLLETEWGLPEGGTVNTRESTAKI